MKIVLDVDNDLIKKIVYLENPTTPVFNCFVCPFLEELMDEDIEYEDEKCCCFFGSKSMDECPVISVEGLYEKGMERVGEQK